MDIPYFACLFTLDGHLGYFQFRALTELAAVNTCMYLLVLRMYPFLLGMCIEVRLLNYRVCICSALVGATI